MSQLLLTVVRCPDNAPVEQRRISGGEMTLGRGSECDWRLHDPARVLSKRHCVLEYANGGWNLRDLSTNGTFVNHAQAPVGPNTSHALNNGDRLTLGPYELEVRIVEARASAEPAWRQDHLPGGPDALSAESGGNAAPLFPEDLRLTEDFGPVTSDHSPSVSGAFRTPSVLGTPFPDDLDLGFEAPLTAPDRSPAPSSPSPPAAAAPSGPIRGEASPPLPVGPKPEGQGATRMLDAAGISGIISRSAAQDPDRVLTRAGTMLREVVAGLRALLVSRADVKREFRIQPTALHMERNNPIKFAATEQQALAALFDPDTPADAAVRETIDDLVLHQAATLAATQAAARALLDRMRPDLLEAGDTGASLMPGAREKRLWEAYKRQHVQLVAQFDDDFDSAFGKAFARAYEEAAARRGMR